MKSNIISFLVLISISNICLSQDNELLDSINKYYLLSNDAKQDWNFRLTSALKAKNLSDEFAVDSIRLRVQRALSVSYYYNELFEPYLKLNQENFKLAEKLNDTSALQASTNNLGSYYLFLEQMDSSYYYYSKKLGYFKSNDISIEKAETLSALADIQQEEKLYNGAELDAINAIKILNRLSENEDTLYLNWSLYNLLAIISKNTLNKNKTLEYYDKSISYTKEMEDGFTYEIFSINNKANAYRTFGEYSKALDLFNALLEEKEKYNEDEPDFYPTLFLNIAKTKFESGDYKFLEVEDFLKKAYDMFKTIEFQNGIMATALEFSRLYLKHNEHDKAKQYGLEALKVS